jgi:Domain of unknown function (DUF305)
MLLRPTTSPFPPARVLTPTRALTLTVALTVTGLAGLAFAQQPAAQDSPPQAPALAAEQPFLDGNDAAMAAMMAGMAVPPSGDVDKDFVDMMVPHHQGAIDMAKLLLRYGKNPKLKSLAQEIIVTQQQEIAAMRLAVGEPLPPSRPSPTQIGN